MLRNVSQNQHVEIWKNVEDSSACFLLQFPLFNICVIITATSQVALFFR